MIQTTVRNKRCVPFESGRARSAARHLLELGVPHEAEVDAAVGQLLVHQRDEGQARLDLLAVSSVQEHLLHLATVSACLPAAAHNVAVAKKVTEDGLEHSSAGRRALHLLQFVHVSRALRHAALRDQQDDVSAEALLQLSGEDLLGLLHELKVAERIEDHEGLAGSLGAWRHDLRGVDVEARQVQTESLVVQLQLVEGLGDVVLEVRRLRALELAKLAQVRLVRHPLFLEICEARKTML